MPAPDTRFAYATRLNGFKADAARVWPGKNRITALDLAHVLYADEMPAYAAALIHRRSRLLGVHLNDGYGKAIYFGTFPDAVGLDPGAESSANIAALEGMSRVLDKLRGNAALDRAITAQDAVASRRILQPAPYGAA